MAEETGPVTFPAPENRAARAALEVPVEQQFGITLWCQTDSPEGSGWRPGQPTGIWDLGFNRKPAYAGIADGLADKE